LLTKILTIPTTFCQDQDQNFFSQDQDQDFIFFVLEAPRDQDLDIEEYITE